YTTDKAQLLNVIDTLPFGGQTALYQAGADAVEIAARAPNPRRVVVLLSDGAEFGGISRAARGGALELAEIRGVPVYTIGLGFGIDQEDFTSGGDDR
ncbi:MAG: VWA domain-containing protein, partial [Leptolyngbyaceae cyanobacterium RM2_2_21]|nr:VWA domain-containing protein [Leptolyngbyaceae cyanobacterium RM2_2_21]